MLKLLGALLVGILSASLAVIYQNDIAAFLGRAPVTAEATPGAWYPHFHQVGNLTQIADQDDEAVRKFASPEDVNFARFVIHNNTSRQIPSAFIRFPKNDFTEFDAVILKKNGSSTERTSVRGAVENIELGDIPPASDVVAYVWSTQTFGYPFGFDGISVVGSDGKMPLTVFHFKAAGDSLPLGLSTEMFAWLMALALFLMTVIILATLYHQQLFVKCLMRDEDYYLSERTRFDESPEKYSVPSNLPTK